MNDFSQNDIISLFKKLSVVTQAEKAFWQLHKHYYKKLFAYISSIVKEKEIAEEVTDDVFINIWNKRSSFESIVKPELYLFVCAKNEALKYLKKKLPQEKFTDDFENIECQFAQDPYNILISSETLKSINNAINLLPPKCKIIFRLIKENNLKYREVAELLEISEKTVENQMTIALKKLTATIPSKLQ